MLYVKKNAKNQMLIYNKNKQSMANHTSNQNSASMLAANPTGLSTGAPSISQHNNFVKPGSNMAGPSSGLTQNTSNTQRSGDIMQPPKTSGGGRKRQGSNQKLIQ